MGSEMCIRDRAVPTLPQTGTTGWMAGVLASLGSLLLACGWFFTRKSKHS